jgi:outer membrane protein TolC
MNTRHIVVFFLIIGTILTTKAQIPTTTQIPAPDTLMKKVLENNKTLKVARESYQVAILDAGTGNTPPDPEVEFGYLFGKPSEMGNRWDFSVSQQVDFPTAYIHKSRLRKIKTTQAELEYVISRQEVLWQARQLWIERLHLNQQEQLLLKRLKQAETINDHFRQKLASGEESQLVYSQSNLQLAALQIEYEQVLAEIKSNQWSLNEIAGGIEVDIKDTIFPIPVRIVPDSLLQVYSNSPAMQLHHRELQLREEQKGLTVSQNLPKISAGYYSESLLDQQFKGFQVGVSVPLWENSNRIKKAKSEVIFAEADAERYTYLQRKEVMQKLEQLESLKSRAHHLEEALGTGKSIEYLILALNTGEISLSEYFYASDFYFRNTQLLLQFKKDQLLTEAELLKVYL